MIQITITSGWPTNHPERARVTPYLPQFVGHPCLIVSIRVVPDRNYQIERTMRESQNAPSCLSKNLSSKRVIIYSSGKDKGPHHGGKHMDRISAR